MEKGMVGKPAKERHYSPQGTGCGVASTAGTPNAGASGALPKALGAGAVTFALASEADRMKAIRYWMLRLGNCTSQSLEAIKSVQTFARFA